MNENIYQQKVRCKMPLFCTAPCAHSVGNTAVNKKLGVEKSTEEVQRCSYSSPTSGGETTGSGIQNIDIV